MASDNKKAKADPASKNEAAAKNKTTPVWNFSGSGVTKIGWTVGAGAELALGGNWTAKIEYLFVDLGSFNTTFTGFPGCFGTTGGAINVCHPQVAGVGNISSKITDNIVRVGLNYQIICLPASAKAPAASRYSPRSAAPHRGRE
jgi:outer membrane immunogenic protein